MNKIEYNLTMEKIENICDYKMESESQNVYFWHGLIIDYENNYCTIKGKLPYELFSKLDLTNQKLNIDIYTIGDSKYLKQVDIFTKHDLLKVISNLYKYYNDKKLNLTSLIGIINRDLVKDMNLKNRIDQIESEAPQNKNIGKEVKKYLKEIKEQFNIFDEGLDYSKISINSDIKNISTGNLNEKNEIIEYTVDDDTKLYLFNVDNKIGYSYNVKDKCVNHYYRLNLNEYFEYIEMYEKKLEGTYIKYDMIQDDYEYVNNKNQDKLKKKRDKEAIEFLESIKSKGKVKKLTMNK